MIGICSGCHTKALATRSLEDADRIETQGGVLVQEASEYY